MKRSRTIDGPNLYDANEELGRCEFEIAKICAIAGLDISNGIDAFTIDEIIFALRKLFRYSSPTFSNIGKPYFDVMRKQNFHLVTQLRSAWIGKQLALARM